MKITLLILAVLILILSIGYAYYGGFSKIEFTVAEAGGETIVYEQMKGEYNQSPKLLDKVYYSLLNNDSIITYKGIGIYYDNPKTVEKENLRSDIGCIIEQKDCAKVVKMTDKYSVKELPRARFIVTEFPNKGMASIMIGLFRVYPALQEFAEKNGYKTGAVTEIYDVPKGKTIYRAEIIE